MYKNTRSESFFKDLISKLIGTYILMNLHIFKISNHINFLYTYVYRVAREEYKCISQTIRPRDLRRKKHITNNKQQ